MEENLVKLIKEFILLALVLAIVLILRAFVVTPIIVDGHSMDPTLQDKEIMLLKKYDRTLERFKIVVLSVNGERLIKRIIALPGEHIKYENNELYIDGKHISDVPLKVTTDDFDLKELYGDVIPQDYYFVMGDNRNASTDSRHLMVGLVHKKDILGTADFVLFPFSKFGRVS